MSTESERFDSFSDPNALNFEVGKGKISETLADPLTGHAQELIAKLDGDEQERNDSLVSAGDNEMENITYQEKQTESVNGGLDLGIGTKNVGGESNDSEKKVLLDSEEVLITEGDKDSDGIEKELHVEKEAKMVCSHGVDLSDVKVSDVRLDSEELVEDVKPNGSEKQGTKDEDLDVLCFMGLEPQDSRHLTEMVESSDSDLVWAKVRSHPWWPGQVFDASAATDKAKKYFKKGSFLVTYFGDCSFAWNEASRIKPFREHFAQMAKQSSLPDFIDAIDFALEEVSRRIEYGLACSCISEEIYQKIKTQNIINPGVREESSSIHGGDKVSSAIFFQPAKLVEYIKRLACSPSCDTTDALQLVSQRARLLAFNRWKGYTDLPEFVTLQGSVESAPNISPAEEESSLVNVSDPKLEKSKQVYTKRRRTEEQDDSKHEGVFEYEDTTVPKKKEKTLAEYIAEKRLSKRSGNTSHENSVKIVHCEKKRKVEHSNFPKSTKKTKADLKSEDLGLPISPANGKNSLAASDKTTPEKATKSFQIGARILKVANQMQFSTPTRLLPCSDSTSKKAAKSHGSTNLVEDPMLETRDLKDSSKDQIVNEDRKEAADIADETTIEDINLTGENNSGLDLKEQPSNKNCTDGSVSCKEDVSTE